MFTERPRDSTGRDTAEPGRAVIVATDVAGWPWRDQLRRAEVCLAILGVDEKLPQTDVLHWGASARRPHRKGRTTLS